MYIRYIVNIRIVILYESSGDEPVLYGACRNGHLDQEILGFLWATNILVQPKRTSKHR